MPKTNKISNILWVKVVNGDAMDAKPSINLR